jgi:hypothetical protein
MLSFLNIPTVERLCAGKITGKISWNSSKNLIYAEGGFPKFIEYKKTWGIEKISNLFDTATNNITKEFMWETRNCYIECHQLKNLLHNGGATCQYI